MKAIYDLPRDGLIEWEKPTNDDMRNIEIAVLDHQHDNKAPQRAIREAKTTSWNEIIAADWLL